MQYALWIGLAVVLIAIGPALIRNMRSAGKRGSSTDTTGGATAVTDSSSPTDCSPGSDGDCGGDGGGD